MELLDATCPGGKSSLAILKLRISHSRPIGAYSCVLDVFGLAAEELTTLNPDGVKLFGQRYSLLRDGRLLLACLADDTLGSQWSPRFGTGILEPGLDQISLKIYLRLEPGTPAGDHAIVFCEGEMADGLTARTIAPALLDGILTVEEDVAFDATADPNRTPWSPGCMARETLPPAGPEDVQAAFSLALVPGVKGSRVTVPFWLEANVPVEGFSFAIYYGNQVGKESFSGKVRLERIVPRLRDGRPWEVFEYEASRDWPDIWGQAIFRRDDPAASLPPGERHHVLDFEFQVETDAPEGTVIVRCVDLSADPELPSRVDWVNAVRAYGEFLDRERVTCLDYFRADWGIVVVGKPTLFRRGDANADGVVSLADAILAGNVKKRSRLQGGCDDAADANDDGAVNLADALSIVRQVFEQPLESAIAPPFPDPGLDETLDPLLCEEYRVTPAPATPDALRVGAVEAAPGESVAVPIYASHGLV